MTTHSNIRVFVISAKYCALAVWHDDRQHLIDKMHHRGFLSIGILLQYIQCWWKFKKTYSKMVILEQILDLQAFGVKSQAWIRGLCTKGLHGAQDAAAGLT